MARDDSFAPNGEQLRESCNVGYAKDACDRVPEIRDADAVRFSVSAADGDVVELRWSSELDHRPAGGGLLRWNRGRAAWVDQPPPASLEELAKAYLSSYLRAVGES